MFSLKSCLLYLRSWLLPAAGHEKLSRLQDHGVEDCPQPGHKASSVRVPSEALPDGAILWNQILDVSKSAACR